MTTSKATFLPGATSAKKYPLTKRSFLNYGRTNDLYVLFTKDVKLNKYYLIGIANCKFYGL